jgi:hypothetical protein
MSSNTAIAHRKSPLRKLLDLLINASLVALVGCSIAAALAFRPLMPGDATQTAMPTVELHSLFDQGDVRASSHQLRGLRVVDTVNAPVGQGWG